MNSWNHNQAESEMVGYLLGDLTEDKLTSFEERYFADDALFDQMLMVKHELVDAYVRNHLDAETHEKFERHFLTTPGGQQEVAFASALREKLNQSQPAPVKTKPSRWQELFGAWSMPEFGLAAAALVLVAVGLGWLWIENRKLSQELASASTERETESKRNEELKQQLAQLTAPTPAPVVVEPQQPEPPIQNDRLYAFNIRPDAKGSSDLPTAKSAAGMNGVRLNLELNFKPVELRCLVELKTESGTTIGRQNLRARSLPQGGYYVQANFRVANLKAGNYKATVTGRDVDDKQETTVPYSFTIEPPGR
jgi:hypothetical protein